MAKRVGVLFARGTRYSESGGTAKTYYHDTELQTLLGAGESIVLHGFVHAVSTTGRLDLTASDTSVPGVSPRDDGNAVTLTGTFSNITAVGPFRAVISGPFAARLEITCDVQDTGTSSQQSVDYELHATIVES